MDFLQDQCSEGIEKTSAKILAIFCHCGRLYPDGGEQDYIFATSITQPTFSFDIILKKVFMLLTIGGGADLTLQFDWQDGRYALNHTMQGM